MSLIILLMTALAGGAALPLLAQGGELDRMPLGASPLKMQLAALAAEKIMLTGTGQEADMAAVVEAALKYDVIVIGEYHDNIACHQFQADFLTALAARYPKLVVGLEFFESGHDEILEMWRTGQVSEKDLLQKTGWYRRSALNYGYTRVVMDVLNKNRIKTIGLNVPRDLIRKVTMRGFAALDPGEKKLFPGWEAANPEHEYYIRATFGTAAVQAPQWFSGIYGSQKCWDVIMAESMRLWLARKELRGHKGVIIAGSGHVAYGLGIPFRYLLQARKARLFTIVPVYVEKKEAGAEENPMLKMLTGSLKPAAVFSRGIADAVLSLPLQGKPHFPVWGGGGRMQGEGFVLSRVDKDSLAEKWGLKAGDTITAVDGRKFSSEEELRTIIAAKMWDEPVTLDLRRQPQVQAGDAKKGGAS